MTLGDTINSILAFFTAAMAAGTVYLGWVTRQLAKETAAATKQADRHHQEDSRPFCVIAFTEPTDTLPFGAGFDPDSRRQVALMSGKSQTNPSNDIRVCGSFQNKGKGPAKDVYVYLNMRRAEDENWALRLTRPVLVSGLIGAGETLEIDVAIKEQDIIHDWDGAGWKPTQVFSSISNDIYEVVVEYKDVFENVFRTVHPRGIWTKPTPDVSTPEKRAEMMIRPNKPTPIFLTGRQAVRTPANLPPPPHMEPSYDAVE
jgi:hypothetical protein